LIHNK